MTCNLQSWTNAAAFTQVSVILSLHIHGAIGTQAIVGPIMLLVLLFAHFHKFKSFSLVIKVHSLMR